MEVFSGLKRFIYSVIRAVLMYFVSQALFDWFNESMDTQILNAGNSISGVLQRLKTITHILAFDSFFLLFAIVSAILMFMKTSDLYKQWRKSWRKIINLLLKLRSIWNQDAQSVAQRVARLTC